MNSCTSEYSTTPSSDDSKSHKKGKRKKKEKLPIPIFNAVSPDLSIAIDLPEAANIPENENTEKEINVNKKTNKRNIDLNGWNPAIDNLLLELEDKAWGYAWMHNKSINYYSTLNDRLSITNIIFSL